ncbi:hypothetical protein DEV91_13917 [Phyllobacterium brassicacearum]|nr:hypothetical protein DEV91_13917 [Phyllobacterium brassicacearum]
MQWPFPTRVVDTRLLYLVVFACVPLFEQSIDSGSQVYQRLKCVVRVWKIPISVTEDS